MVLIAAGLLTPQMVLRFAGATTPIRILSLSSQQLALVQLIDKSAVGIIVPKGIYKGVDYDVTTISVPVAAYATTRMDDATAYAVTRAFWTSREAMAKQNAWWEGVSRDMVGTMGAKLHPGALKYYNEAKIAVPAALR
ncbi:MAG: hypothetical protein HY057_10040 [Rhodospirillales bacterium]|nr:hypothetical protein [Rhodospirillales bacterium]